MRQSSQPRCAITRRMISSDPEIAYCGLAKPLASSLALQVVRVGDLPLGRVADQARFAVERRV